MLGQKENNNSNNNDRCKNKMGLIANLEVFMEHMVHTKKCIPSMVELV